MSVVPLRSETSSRSARMLRTALGAQISRWLEDPGVIEVMLNPDGALWIDRLGEGLSATAHHLSPADGERIIRLVAHHVGAEVHASAPRVSAELPDSGERFEGLLPPVVAAPSFAIRKPAVAVFTLADYVASGVIADWQASALADAVASRKNILVAGGTSSGKTTLTNALLAEVAASPDRVVLIEDTRELQCAAPNLVALRTKDGVATLSDLVRSALRLRPEGLVDLRPGEGYRVPRLTEKAYRDLYVLSLLLLEAACRHDPPQSTEGEKSDDSADYVAAVRSCFESVGRRSGNRALHRTLGQLNDQLHHARRMEPLVLKEAQDEIAELGSLVGGSGETLFSALQAFHQLRIERSSQIVQLFDR